MGLTPKQIKFLEDHILNRPITRPAMPGGAVSGIDAGAGVALLGALQEALQSLGPTCARDAKAQIASDAGDIRALLTGAPDDTALAAADRSLDTLKLAIGAANEAAAKDIQRRIDKKSDLLAGLKAVSALAEATATERQERADLAAKMPGFLAATPPTDQNLTDAQKALAVLQDYVDNTENEIETKRKPLFHKGKAAEKHLKLISLEFAQPCPEDRLQGLVAEHAVLADLIAPLVDWAQIADADAEDLVGIDNRLRGFEQDAAKLRADVDQAIVARTERIAAALAGAKKLADPQNAHQFDITDLTRLRGDARFTPVPPFTDASVTQAEAALAELQAVIATLTTTIASRGTRLSQAVSQAAALADPAKARAADLLALKPYREHHHFNPVPPLSDQEVDAAEAALAELKGKVVEVTKDIATREVARTKLDQRLIAIARVPHALPIEARDLLAKRRALRDQAASADDLEAIKALEGAVKALEDEVAKATALFLARHTAQTALSGVQEAVKTHSSQINKSCYDKALSDLAAIQSAQKAATSLAAYKDIPVKSKALLDFLPEAVSYYGDLVQWRYDTRLFIGAMATDPPAQLDKKTAFEKLRTDLMAAADALAAGGNPGGAKSKLDEFTTTKVTANDSAEYTLGPVALDASKSFAARLKLFTKTTARKIVLIRKSKIPQPSPNFEVAFNKAKEKGWKDGDWGQAKTALDVLATAIDACHLVAEMRLNYSALKGNSTVDAAVVAMVGKCGIPDYPAALAALTAIDTGDLKKAAEYARRRKAMARNVEALIAKLDPTNRAILATPWADAETKVKVDDKLAELDKIDPILGDLRDWARLADALKVQGILVDPTDTYNILKEADAQAGANKYQAAIIALNIAKTDFAELVQHKARLERLATLKTAIPTSETKLHSKIDGGTLQADTKALVHDWGEAKSLAEAVLNDPDVQARATEIEAYLLRKKRTQIKHKRLLAQMKYAKVRKRLEIPMIAATDKAEKDFDYTQAASLLDSHATLLNRAQTYVGTRTRALNAVAAMDRAAAISATAKAAIYAPPNDKAGLDAKMDKAEAKAITGDFNAATTLFLAILKDAQIGMKAAGDAFEAADDGHYLAAHGPPPGVSDEQLKARILTGIRPDGVNMPSSTSSQFDSIEAFLATRERAVDGAAAKGVNVTLMKLPASTTRFELVVNTETEVPAGKAYVSDHPKIEMRAGELKKGRFFENYREMEGLTKVVTKFVFRFADPYLTASSEKKIKNAKAYKARYAEYMAADSSVPDFSEYTGKWVVHQHYPTPKGFDPDSGTYPDG